MAGHRPHPWKSIPPGSQASRVHAPAAQPSPWEDGPCPHAAARVWTAVKAVESHRAAGPTPSLQPSGPKTAGLGLARDPQREGQKPKHPCPQPQAPRLPHGQTGASVPHPSPPLLSGRLGLGESLRTWGLKGPRAPHSPGSDHRPLEICTYGLGQPLSHRGLPSPPAPGIPAKPALPHSSTLTRTRGCG